VDSRPGPPDIDDGKERALVDRAGITQALKEAVSIVDEVLPWELGLRNASMADRTELRKAAIPAVFTALLGGQLDVPEDIEGDDELLTSGQAAKLLRVDPNVERSNIGSDQPRDNESG
jgi:hypothetical protein